MSRQHTILVVDDNAVNLEMLSNYLKSSGYRVLVAADGESALEQAALANPDLVLMDVLMPGMSGFDAARALHRQRSTARTPVIFLTALSRTADKMEGFRAGGVDYLTKPLQFEEVLARIRVHLQLRDLSDDLERRNAELQEQDRRRNQLFSIIAHDLSAPMASIADRLNEVAHGDPTDPYHQEMLESVAARAGQMSELLTRLLDWGRIQIASDAMDTEAFAFEDAVRAVITLLDSRIEKKKIDVRTSVPAGLRVTLNQTALETILNNLLSNAIKFSPVGGLVLVDVSVDRRRVVLAVTDHGVGMSADDLETLLESEKRIQRKGTEGESGSGLGLLLTRDLVSRMNGTLTAESEPGHGTTFRVQLPDDPEF